MKRDNLLHLPSEEEVNAAKELSRPLSKYADKERVRVSIKGEDDGVADEMVIPGQFVQIMLRVFSEMSKGNAINILPVHYELSTQEAANLLNVSRPYLVKLLENGDIPFHKVGVHRRVKFEDVMKYKSDIDGKRYEALSELAALSQDMGMGYN
jgi:excisionase family DNA binding protein